MTKTLSFGAMHISVAFAVVYLMTGDWLTGGLVALVEPCVNTVAFHFHEKFWNRTGSVTSRPLVGRLVCAH
ncbi:MAG: DUF2061 domain-containing protein [Pseudomonadota bacterium]|nr:DUF2061 domain-containing protein [Pseudomonadota bacterium]